MEIKLIPQIIEFKAFQFAFFKRKVTITEDAIQFNTKTFLANEIIAVRYSRINRVAGNRIASSDYKIELRSNSGAKIKISFSHVVSQGNPEKIEKAYFDIINALSPIQNNILRASLEKINSGERIQFENVVLANDGVEIKGDFLHKAVSVPWHNLKISYNNGELYFFDSVKKVGSLYCNNIWNIKVLEDVCNGFIKKNANQLVTQ